MLGGLLLVSLTSDPLLGSDPTAMKSCGDLGSLSVGDTCQAEWSSVRDFLRPTQPSVGFAWVFRIFLKDMKSKGDAQDTMDGKIVPVTLGPAGFAYILNHHHHLAALDLSGYKTVKVSIFISCNFSSIPARQQLDHLAARGYAYLYDHPAGSPDTLPTAVPAASLPSTIAFRSSAVTMSDDPWRALSSFSRKVKDGPIACPKANSNHCGRAYDRVCGVDGKGIPFFEFRWAYLYSDALNKTSLWPNATAATTFSRAYAALTSPTPSSPATSVDDWQVCCFYAQPARRNAHLSPKPIGRTAALLSACCSPIRLCLASRPSNPRPAIRPISSLECCPSSTLPPSVPLPIASHTLHCILPTAPHVNPLHRILSHTTSEPHRNHAVANSRLPLMSSCTWRVGARRARTHCPAPWVRRRGSCQAMWLASFPSHRTTQTVTHPNAPRRLLTRSRPLPRESSTVMR
jgi:hypothetical protein